MAITDRQAAAIRRRKQQARFDREQADERARTGTLMGFQDPADVDPDTVGWYRKQGGSLKGEGHLCRRCSPERPVGYFAVNRIWLAARSACTACGVPLELVPAEGVTGNEKK